MKCRKDGGQLCRSCSTQMSDEEISRKSTPELIEIAKHIMDEIEIRAMQEAGEEGERNEKK